MSRMLDAALWWADKGVPVIPLHYPIDGMCSCGQSSCSNVAKHPIAGLARNGLHSATTDPETIRKWWTDQPEANVGVRTGLVFDVIDVDSAEGAQTLSALFAEHGTPENLGMALSGRQGVGMHVYAVPGGQKALAGGRTAPDGIDVKGRGGYVVAPPSVHASGKPYAWRSNEFDSGEVQGSIGWPEFYERLRTGQPAPARTPVRLDVQASDAYGAAVLRRASELVRTAVEGHRWQTVATESIPLVARAIDGGVLDHDTAVRELEESAESIGLSSPEIRRIAPLVDDLLTRGITNPIRGTAERTEFTPLPEYESEDEARADEWPEPWPLTHPTPAFPVSVFGWLEPYIKDVAETYQVPTDLVGMMLLATTSAIIGKSTRVQVTETWDEPMNLYIAVVLRAGETKSPALSHLLKPLRELEKSEREAAGEEIKRLAFERELAEAEVKSAKDAAVKAKSEFDKIETQNRALEAREKLDKIPTKVLPLRLAGDMTPEALITKLAEQGGQLAHISAEGDLLDSIVGGRYSAGAPSIGGLLMAHDGREPVKVHRKHADDIEVHDPCLTLGLAIQPDVLSKMGTSDAAMNRGLAARFLYSIPASRVGTRNMTLSSRSRSSIDDISSKLLNSLKSLLSGCFEDFEATITGYDVPPDGRSEALKDMCNKYVLEDTTISILEHYRSELEARRAGGTGDLSDIAAWSNKLDGQCVRLAGILQTLRDAGPGVTNPDRGLKILKTRPVEPSTMADAVTLSEYLIAHAVEAHAMMRATESGERADRSRQLLGWLKDRGEHEVTKRDIQQSLRRRASFRNVDTITAACDDLERAGWLRRLPDDPGKSGRPSVRYLVHPNA